jgi:hypothetical protein
VSVSSPRAALPPSPPPITTNPERQVQHVGIPNISDIHKEALARHEGEGVEQLANELIAAQLLLGEAENRDRQRRALQGEIRRLEERLAKEQEASKRLRAENDELDVKLATQEVELRHIRSEGDRLAKILTRAVEDADALGL